MVGGATLGVQDFTRSLCSCGSNRLDKVAFGEHWHRPRSKNAGPRTEPKSSQMESQEVIPQSMADATDENMCNEARM